MALAPTPEMAFHSLIKFVRRCICRRLKAALGGLHWWIQLQPGQNPAVSLNMAMQNPPALSVQQSVYHTTPEDFTKMLIKTRDLVVTSAQFIRSLR